MLGDKVMQSSLITGSATDYTLTAVTSWQTWRQVFADTSAVLYVAENSDGSTWEIGYGTLAYGPPDKITGRTLITSSTGALINWQTTDAPIYVFSATLNTVLKHLLSPLVNGVANVMGWLPAGALWLDYALGIATAWVKKRYISGTRTSAASHAEEGRHYLGLSGGAANIYAASLRSKFEDKGAAGYTLTADDIGKTLAFDCTAASRTLTGIAAATTGVGHGFYFFVQPYGSSSNGVTFAPAGGDTTDLATAPATRRTMYIYDGAKGTWRADYVLPSPTPGGYLNALRNGTFIAWPNGGIGGNISVAAGASGSACIGAGGWAILASGAAVTVTQDNDAAGAARAMKVTGNTSVTGLVIGQRIEASDADLLIAGKRVTFQMAVYNNTGASITPQLATRVAGSADNWASPVADIAATNLQACPNGQWTTVAYTFDVGASAYKGYEVKIDFGNNFSTNVKSVTVAAAELKPTSGVATGLNASPPTPELAFADASIARSSRYFQATYDNGTAPGTATRAGMVGWSAAASGTNFAQAVLFPIPMRAAPTVTYYDGAGNSGKTSYYLGSWNDNLVGPTVLATGQKSATVYQSTNNANLLVHYAAYADFW